MRRYARLSLLVVIMCLCSVQIHAADDLVEALPFPYAAPEFVGIESWLNGEPLTLKKLAGKVVLVDFWTYSCINCIRTLPYLNGWYEKYRDRGFVIVGVHSPEFAFEKNRANVQAALVKYGIHYPVALDNDMQTWNAFKNRYWPAHYLIDQQGQVVYKHFGEGNYDITEKNIRTLLRLPEVEQTSTGKSLTSSGQTPETYLGYARAKTFASLEPVVKDKVAHYSLPKELAMDHWALAGKWQVEAERITSEEAGAKLQLHFTSGKVFLVLGSRSGKPIRATLKLNGKPVASVAGQDAPGGVLRVDQHALYELIRQPGVASGVLTIEADSPGLQAYAFTFGN